MMAFLLPTAVVVTDALLRGLSVRHPVDETSAVNVLAIYDAIMLRFMVFVVGCARNGAVAGLLGMLRGQEWAAQIVPLMLGFTIISIGNLLPELAQTSRCGIRTRRTLSDRALWIRVHRSAGYIVVACGAVIVFLGDCRAGRPLGPADGPPGWACRTPRNLASRPAFRQARPCLKEVPGEPPTAWLALASGWSQCWLPSCCWPLRCASTSAPGAIVRC